MNPLQRNLVISQDHHQVGYNFLPLPTWVICGLFHKKNQKNITSSHLSLASVQAGQLPHQSVPELP